METVSNNTKKVRRCYNCEYFIDHVPFTFDESYGVCSHETVLKDYYKDAPNFSLCKVKWEVNFMVPVHNMYLCPSFLKIEEDDHIGCPNWPNCDVNGCGDSI